MDSFQRRLISELIGLARATDGNEHLITADSTSVILEALAATPKNEEELQFYLDKIIEAKQIMVPNCFLCANPCGRTNACDFLTNQEEPEILEAKLQIVKELQTIARQNDLSQEGCLYRGLIVLGLDGYCAAELYSIFTGTQS